MSEYCVPAWCRAGDGYKDLGCEGKGVTGDGKKEKNKGKTLYEPNPTPLPRHRRRTREYRRMCYYYNIRVGFRAYSFQKYFVLYSLPSFFYWKMYAENMTYTCRCSAAVYAPCIILLLLYRGNENGNIYSNTKTNISRTCIIIIIIIYCGCDVHLEDEYYITIAHPRKKSERRREIFSTCKPIYGISFSTTGQTFTRDVVKSFSFRVIHIIIRYFKSSVRCILRFISFYKKFHFPIHHRRSVWITIILLFFIKTDFVDFFFFFF